MQEKKGIAPETSEKVIPTDKGIENPEKKSGEEVAGKRQPGPNELSDGHLFR